MRKLMVTLLALTLAACASMGKYSQPKETSAHALVKVESHLGDKNQQGGWQMPGMASSDSYKVMLFLVDGDKITAQGGVPEVRVKPGPHQLQVMVDDGLIPLSGDVSGSFEKGHVYGVRIYKDEQGDKRYRADLVDQANGDAVMGQARF